VSAWRHLRAIVLLPGVAAVAVPALIVAGGAEVEVGWGLDGVAAALPALAGGALIVAGAGFWAWTVRLLARIGEGTLAPWDPTRRLVVAGPYAYVRNPMITAVLAVLLGEAALLGAPALLVWFAVFLAINWLYFPLIEEPGLDRRFGEEYREYKRGVPRWLPRRTAWAPPR
jgi:protein-S-isoprenylcysteine O-methyltransferase Ste14